MALGPVAAALEAVGGFEEAFPTGEDADLGRRVRKARYRLGYAPQAVVYHEAKRTWLKLLATAHRYGKGAELNARRHGIRGGHTLTKGLLRWVTLPWGTAQHLRQGLSTEAACRLAVLDRLVYLAAATGRWRA